jgi:hypothetical protein
MAQRSISRIYEGDLPLAGLSRPDANEAARIPKLFIPTVLYRRDKKLISKRQVAQLFGVSMHTIDCWLHDGNYQNPKEPSHGRNGIMRSWSLAAGLN